MKKILCLVLTLTLILSLCCTATYAYEVPRIIFSATSSATETQHYGSDSKHILMPGDAKEIGQLFTVGSNKQLTEITIRWHSWGNNIGSITMNLYYWNNDYKTTKKSKPLFTHTFVDFSDSQKMSVPLSSPIDGGDILAVFSNPVEQVGPWYTSFSQGKMFVDGVHKPDSSIELTYSTIELPKPTESGNIDSQNAYNDIDMLNYTEALEHTMPNFTWSDGITRQGFNAKTNKAYFAYYVDFGDVSPKGAEIEVFGSFSEAKQAQLILDDLKTGTVLCTFPIMPFDDDSVAGRIPAKINANNITGVHKVYLMIDAGFSATTFKFTTETPGNNPFENLLEEFNATNNFELKSTYSDTWTATDMIGRKLVDHSVAGDFNPDKQVGLFYWTWHATTSRQITPLGNNQQIIVLYPGDEWEIKNDMNYKDWRSQGSWNESIYGYYSGFDRWVMRKQLELLSSAGVDGLFFDATNGATTYTLGYMRLAEQMHQMHQEGIQTPGFAFMLPFFDYNLDLVDLERVYENLYAHGLYSDCWYYWDGKPVVMGYPDNLYLPTGSEERDAQHAEILDFFTFRPGQASYFSGPSRDNHWPWLEVYPQKPYGTSEKYGCEAVSVGVAMNATPQQLTAMNGTNVLGRSYTYKDGFSKLSATSKYYGYNFLEQWERARELNPEFVFVTGWNEWAAGHHVEWMGVAGAYPDQYNDEYSRDIEPTNGEFKDTYFYLLANEIRKFKGVRPTPVASAAKTIDINSDFSQWSDVGPEFIGYAGGTEPRSSKLNDGNATPVTNNTGRNDIVLSKVARDSDNLYFYVETKDAMTPYTDPSWMQLFINTDRTYKTGWEGYDFIINRVNPTSNTAAIEKWIGSDNMVDWKWEKVADVSYKQEGNKMMISVPRTVLGVTGNVDIEFKWNDNMQVKGDIMDFYINGDTAPVGRFAYHYTEDLSTSKKIVDEPINPENLMTQKIKKFVVLALGKNYAYKFSNKVKIDDQSDITAPMIINDKTMVPVRFLSECIGARVEWNDANKTVLISKAGYSRITLTLNSNIMKLEKKQVTLQSPATEIDNRIYVPLRDIVEALEITCNWIEPGIIILGNANFDYTMLYVNGGMDQLFNAFEMN